MLNVMTRQNRLKCRDQVEAAECSKNTHTSIKEQARVIYGEVFDKGKIQARAKAGAESKNSPESKTVSKTYKQGKARAESKSRQKVNKRGEIKNWKRWQES